MSAEQNRSPESVVREIRRKTRRKFTVGGCVENVDPENVPFGPEDSLAVEEPRIGAAAPDRHVDRVKLDAEGLLRWPHQLDRRGEIGQINWGRECEAPASSIAAPSTG